MISEIEIDSSLPPTPVENGFLSAESLFSSSINLLGYISALNLYPVVYQGENDGQLIRHVVPKKGLETEISSYGSHQTFFPHADNPDLRLRGEKNYPSLFCQTPVPDTLTLLCLRQHENVATSILLLDDVLSDLSAEELHLLQEPQFTISRPASFQDGHLLHHLPVLVRQEDGVYHSRFDYHNVSSSSPQHESALNRFKSLALDEKKWKALYLRPGQAVTFNNQRTLHTRNGFQPRFDGKDRWLLRVFGLYQPPQSSYLFSASCNHHLKTI